MMFRVVIKADGEQVGEYRLNLDQQDMMKDVQEGLQLLGRCPLIASGEIQAIEDKVVRRMMPTLKFELTK